MVGGLSKYVSEERTEILVQLFGLLLDDMISLEMGGIGDSAI